MPIEHAQVRRGDPVEELFYVRARFPHDARDAAAPALAKAAERGHVVREHRARSICALAQRKGIWWSSV